jgi:hypothetical protein
LSAAAGVALAGLALYANFQRARAGHAESELRLFREAGESFPRSDEVLAWSRGIVSATSGSPK